MQVEDVARIGFTPRRTAQEKRHRAVSGGMLRQIVVNAKGMTALVHEVLRHGDARVRRKVLQGSAVRRRRSDDDGIFHRAGVLERLDDACNRRRFLADGNVDADAVLPLLVEDRIDGNRRLARAAVADDELALAAADRHEAVDRLETCLQRLMDGLSVRDARSGELDGAMLCRLNGALAVDRTPKSVDDATDHVLANRHLHDLLRALDRRTFFDFRVATQDNGADVVLIEVQGKTVYIIAEIEQLACHGFREAVDMGDAVTDLDNSADIINVQIDVVVLDLVFDDGCYFFRIHFHLMLSPQFLTCSPVSRRAVLQVCPVRCRRCACRRSERSHRR